MTFTTLFPNAKRPNHGIFVENRLRHLLKGGLVDATVLAPVAWRREQDQQAAVGDLHEFRIVRPCWTPVPGIGMPISPWLLYISAARAVSRLVREGKRFDLIDAHYFYPDGVAATWLGHRFGLPVVVTARGSDVTQFPHYTIPRRLILDAAKKAHAIITVSAGLRDALVALGASPRKITVLRNGVDLEMFRPMDQQEARRAFKVQGRVMASVGGLIERKGHHRTIAALEHLPGWQLLIAGDGPERVRLASLARRLGVADRVRFLGPLPHAELRALYSAADISVLSSSREGWANVLLESMACGTPVVASPIPGNPEVIQSKQAGIIAKENSPSGLAKAVQAWESSPSDRSLTRKYAERFGWNATSEGQIRLFSEIIEGQGTVSHSPA